MSQGLHSVSARGSRFHYCCPNTQTEDLQPSNLQVPCAWWLHSIHQDVWDHWFLLNTAGEYVWHIQMQSMNSNVGLRVNGSTGLRRPDMLAQAEKTLSVNWLRLSNDKYKYSTSVTQKEAAVHQNLFWAFQTNSTTLGNHSTGQSIFISSSAKTQTIWPLWYASILPYTFLVTKWCCRTSFQN